MKEWQIVIPSKTFVIGEYLALQGQTALLLISPPFFKVNIHYKANQATPILPQCHPNSPASCLLSKQLQALNGWQLELNDPHQAQGGFGASSALFVASYCLLRLAKGLSVEPENQSWCPELLTSYLNVCDDNQPIPPSGYDVLAQYQSMQINGAKSPEPKLLMINRQQLSIKALNWPFNDIIFELYRTGNKCNTHDHLTKLPQINTKDLSFYMHMALEAIQVKDQIAFVNALQNYQKNLASLNLQTEISQYLCKQLLRESDVLAAKGCGAMGSDVVLALRKSDPSAFNSLTVLLNEEYAA